MITTTKEALWKEILQDPLNIDAWHMYADVLVQLNEDPMTAELIYNDIENKSYQFSSEVTPYVDQRDIAGYIIQTRVRFSYYLLSYHDQMHDIIRRHPTLKYVTIYNDAHHVIRTTWFNQPEVRFTTNSSQYVRKMRFQNMIYVDDNMLLKHLLAEQFPSIRWTVL